MTKAKQKIELTLDTKKIEKHFTEGQIKVFMRKLSFSYTETLFYLWLYNYVSICRKQLETDNGRPMYREFAIGMNKLFSKCRYEKRTRKELQNS